MNKLQKLAILKKLAVDEAPMQNIAYTNNQTQTREDRMKEIINKLIENMKREKVHEDEKSNFYPSNSEVY